MAESGGKGSDRHEDVFLELCRRILALPDQEGVDAGDSVMQAINHPVGHVTEALLDFWFRRDPNDNDGLPADLVPLLTQLCDTSVDRYRHGRIVMASRLIALFRVDRAWTEAHLLHLFNWSRPAEAQSLWQGFLWSPRLYSPLLAAFKTDFLETARHYAELGEHAGQYATLLTYAALDSEGVFAPRELYDTFNVLPGGPASIGASPGACSGGGWRAEGVILDKPHPAFLAEGLAEIPVAGFGCHCRTVGAFGRRSGRRVSCRSERGSGLASFLGVPRLCRAASPSVWVVCPLPAGGSATDGGNHR